MYQINYIFCPITFKINIIKRKLYRISNVIWKKDIVIKYNSYNIDFIRCSIYFCCDQIDNV